MLLAGDEVTEVMGTVSALTSGTQRKLDVAAITTDISDTQAETQYMKDWKHIQTYMAYLLRSLDVRIIEIPPNLALAIVRAFGDEALRNRLNQKTATPAAAVKNLRDSMLGELILESGPRDRRRLKKTSNDTREEFVRIQSMARANDFPLNAAFGTAIGKLLEESGLSNIDVAKKQSVYGTLRPDIHIKMNAATPICLEFTWRTTGFQVDGIDSGNQNTLTPGHIRQYVLQKSYEYVKALGLDQIAK